LCVFSFFLAMLWGASWNSRNNELLGVCQVFLLFAVTWETALLTARSVHDEVSGKTIASLVMLPRTVAEVLYSKMFGTLIGAYPGFVCFVVANVLGIANVVDFYRHGPVVFIVAHFVLVPHLAAIYALWLRWGAVPLAIGSMIGSIFVWVTFFEANRISERSGIVTFVGLLTLGICAACHWILLSRIRHIAARG